MKLKVLEFADMKKESHIYVYTYLLQGTSFFKKRYYKIIFKSKLPHFWWSEIQSVMGNSKIYFEDLNGKETNIRIGSLVSLDLQDNDKEKYGIDVRGWKRHLDNAVEKQMKFTKEYNAKFGQPDLKGTGLWSDFDQNKDWD